jgi:cell division septation protein DedD
MTGAADVPLIRADERPTKVKPEKPGGMEVPDRDKLIYTQKRAMVEHLLPPPEKPMARPATPSAATSAEKVQPTTAAAAVGAATTAAGPMPQAQPQQPASKPLAKPGSPAAAQKPSGVRIQLASVGSEEAARQEWDRIRRANPDLLASISAAPVRADLGDRGIFYRLLTAPVADADRICGELKRRNVGCVIAR